MEPQTSSERELDLLESIHQASRPPHQRDLARAIGLSLGMTNAILKRMARKGWLSIRKINNRNIQYIVSPQGLEAIARRSYSYLRRTIGNVVRYRETIEGLVRHASLTGSRVVVLVGESDLDFIVEHACARAGLTLRRQPGASADTPSRAGELVLLSERLHERGMGPVGAVALSSVLTEAGRAR